jgi:hypothetical protein
MSIRSEEDVAHNSHSCLQCWPTGVACLRFYIFVFFSVCAFVGSGAYIIMTNGTDEGFGCDAKQLLVLVIGLWISPTNMPSSNADQATSAGILTHTQGSPHTPQHVHHGSSDANRGRAHVHPRESV